ncbi:hypothetical protein ACOME3_009707 [Neoechinorhynchus agilis]
MIGGDRTRNPIGTGSTVDSDLPPPGGVGDDDGPFERCSLPDGHETLNSFEKNTNANVFGVVTKQTEESERIAKVTRVETTIVVRRRKKHLFRTKEEYTSPESASSQFGDQAIEQSEKMIGLNTPENTKANKEVDDVIEGADDEEGIEHTLQTSYEGLFTCKANEEDHVSGKACWRDPDLNELVEYLNDPDDAIKANAAAYLQHLSYNNDEIKASIKSAGGVLSTVLLLRHDNPVIQRNACGVLLNLCHGLQNESNKLEVYKVGGIEALSNLVGYSAYEDIRETAAAVLWNISSSSLPEIKMTILDSDCLNILVRTIVIPYSGWHRDASRRLNPQGIFPCLFKNATGILRNCSAATTDGRYRVRSCYGLLPSLVHAVQSALCSRNEVNSKCIENCICILRNLSYRICDRGSQCYQRSGTITSADSSSRSSTLTGSGGTIGGEGFFMNGSAEFQEHQSADFLRHQLYQLLPALVTLIRISTNEVTVESIAGIFQNLTSLSQDKHSWNQRFRSEIRKAKGIHALIELLKLDKCDRVVSTAAGALRNLAIDDERNRDIIAEFGLKDLILILAHETDVLPDPFIRYSLNAEWFTQNTIALSISALNELVKSNEFIARNTAELGLVDRLLGMLRSPHLYSIKLLSSCAHLLNTMWRHKQLHELYKKMGYSSSDFTSHQKLLYHLASSSTGVPMSGASTSCLMTSSYFQAVPPDNHMRQRRRPDVSEWSSTWSGVALPGSWKSDNLSSNCGTSTRVSSGSNPFKTRDELYLQSQSLATLYTVDADAGDMISGTNPPLVSSNVLNQTNFKENDGSNSAFPLYATVRKTKRQNSQPESSLLRRNHKDSTGAITSGIDDPDSSWV